MKIEHNIMTLDCDCGPDQPEESAPACQAKMKITKYLKSISVRIGPDDMTDSYSIDLNLPTMIAIAAFIFKENT